MSVETGEDFSIINKRIGPIKRDPVTSPIHTFEHIELTIADQPKDCTEVEDVFLAFLKNGIYNGENPKIMSLNNSPQLATSEPQTTPIPKGKELEYLQGVPLITRIARTLALALQHFNTSNNQ